jgi:hypothetical protein
MRWVPLGGVLLFWLAAACASDHPSRVAPGGAATFDVLETWSAAAEAAGSRIRGPRATHLAGRRVGGELRWTWTFLGARGEVAEVAADRDGVRVLSVSRVQFVRAPDFLDLPAVRVRPADVLASQRGKTVEAMALSASGSPPRARWFVELASGERVEMDAGATAE